MPLVIVVCYTAIAKSSISSPSGWSKEEGGYDNKRKALSLYWWNGESQKRSKLRRSGANLLILSLFLSMTDGEHKRYSVDFGKTETIRNQWPIFLG